jgi:hypothetical protein
VSAHDDSPGPLLEDRFAIVPEWLLDAEIDDAAVCLYAVLPPSAPFGPNAGTVLLAAGDVRIVLQTHARRQVETAGLPVTRGAVVCGAYRLLTGSGNSPGAA